MRRKNLSKGLVSKAWQQTLTYWNKLFSKMKVAFKFLSNQVTVVQEWQIKEEIVI